MAEALVVVDSPQKAEIVQNYFDKDVETMIVTSPPYQVSHQTIANSDQISFSFKLLPGNESIAEKLAEYAKKSVYLCLDDDARSEYLGWMIYEARLQENLEPAKRLLPLGITKQELDQALQFVDVVDESMAKKHYARMAFDRFLAKNLQRLIGTTVGPGNFPLNFSSLSAMYLIADREDEIRMFAPAQKWEAKCRLEWKDANFTARLEESEEDTTDGYFKTADLCKNAIAKFRDEAFTVADVERSKLEIQPPAPYQMAELLQDAFIFYGLQPQIALECWRSLAHGVKLQDGPSGLVSTFFSRKESSMDRWQESIRAAIEEQYGTEVLHSSPMELTPGMLVPLRPELSGETLRDVLNDNERHIYDLIRTRALASQMVPASGESVRVYIDAGGTASLAAHFNAVEQRGFLEIYSKHYDEKLLAPCPVKDLKKGDDLKLVQTMPELHVRHSVEYYTLESLFSDLGDLEIQLDPYHVLMIQGMLQSGYLQQNKEGYIRLGENALKTVSITKKAFPRMQGMNLSAYIEQTVNEFVTGRKNLDFALKQFDQTLMAQGKVLVKKQIKLPGNLRKRQASSSRVIRMPDQKPATAASEQKKTPTIQPPGDLPTGTGMTSPAQEPGQDEAASPNSAASAPQLEVDADALVDQENITGDDKSPLTEDEIPENLAEESITDEDVLAGSEDEAEAFIPETEDEWPDEIKAIFAKAGGNVKEPETIEPEPEEQAGEELIQTDLKKICLVCGKPMLLKQDRFGRFWSCSGFPACRHSEAFSESEGPEMACPLCIEGRIVKKRTPTGRDFYVCIEPDCEFMAWSKPYYIACQVCDSPYLIEKRTPSGKEHLRCPKAGCGYMQAKPGAQDDFEPTEQDISAPVRKKVRVRRVAKGSGAASGKKKVRVVRKKR